MNYEVYNLIMNNATSDIDMQLLADIRTAKSIITPAADNTSGDVAVMTDASDQTYSYSLIAGALYRQITLPAAGPLVRITPPEVRVVSINFSRINNSFSDGLRYTVNIAHTPRANALDSSLSISHTNSGATLR